MAFFINQQCTSCNACLPECPTGSIFIAKKLYLIDADTCRNCKLCVAVCPVSAIHPLPGEKKQTKSVETKEKDTENEEEEEG